MTTISFYDTVRGGFAETDVDLEHATLTLTVRSPIGGGVLAYPLQYDITLAQLRRLLAEPTSTPKPKTKVVT